MYKRDINSYRKQILHSVSITLGLRECRQDQGLALRIRKPLSALGERLKRKERIAAWKRLREVLAETKEVLQEES
jgi:hypothetical protein